ncbi:putative F-box protein At3g17480 isoform X1 [Daucus carota subsp. sativus]|uniref:putative F-box protein At3g17480 isoform X1 n=1 Tax=Daucus carota subsp. sativus TaxID=79200 RepID=UPI0007EFD232|nr:PREDICTED: putative F-box protein At3g17480 isoform X1 [Daucus carota subsp. sativus]
MAKTGRDNYLPEEIIFIVLSWLPVKTLLRFKSVCKSWRSMISDTQFVGAHLSNSRRKPAVLLNFVSFDRHIDVHYTPEDSYRFYLPPNVNGMKYICSCDGLVCLSNAYCDVIYIWNPLTKLLKLLPRPSKNLKIYRGLLALGFDPISNDYKLLRIAGVEAELYSSKADSWKHVQVPETLKALRASSKVVNAKPGILYMTSGKDIIAFDLHKEVFRLYTIPPCKMSDILEFNGEAAMVFKSDDGSALSLFVLNDVCGEVFWTKLLDLEFDDNISRVLPSLATAKFVTENDNEAKKYALRFHGDGKGMVIKYTESLVYLQGFQRQVESNRYLKQ